MRPARPVLLDLADRPCLRQVARYWHHRVDNHSNKRIASGRRAAHPPGRPHCERRFPPKLDSGCEWLVAHDVVSADVVRRNRQVAEAALRPWTPVFIHGDLQIVHVFVDGDEVRGVVDWSEGGQGDAMYDLATLTLAHEERLDDVVAGYGGGVEIDVIRAYWSLRSLMAIRWLFEHGYGAPATFPEVAVLNFLSASS